MFFASCQKDNAEKKGKSHAELLKSGKWQVVAASMHGSLDGEQVEEDIFHLMKECGKDDFMTFDDSNIYIDQGDDLCEPDDPQVKVVAYQLPRTGPGLILDREYSWKEWSPARSWN